MKKVLYSLLTIGVVAAVAVYATQAFFSDTETSVGNVLEAGSIDLKIDNESYYGTNEEGFMVRSLGTSWQLKDLENELFFDFHDLKPGDIGEDTVSIHVSSNPAWACVNIDITQDDDNGTTDSELDDGDEEDSEWDIFDGELASQLNFIFWADDGDNVLELEEEILARGSASDVWGGASLPLADSQGGIFGNTPLEPDTTYYIGKAWCFGELTPEPLAQESNDGPDMRGPGVTCDGSGVNNLAQTDLLRGNISFYAEQARNNPGFVCSQEQEHEVLVLENKNEDGWYVLNDDVHGTLTWKGDGPTFDFSNSLTAQGLLANTDYSLIYYADPWPGNNPGALNPFQNSFTSN